MEERKMLSAHELSAVSGSTVINVIPEPTAEALPLATRRGRRVQVVFLYYEESMVPGEEVLYPPSYILVLDASTGEVVRFEACSPQTLGVEARADQATVGFGLDPTMPASEFWNLTDRFLDISAIVWAAFAEDASQYDPETLAYIEDYRRIFERIAKVPLVPYYKAVAPDFFRWLDEVTR
ncbi:MAG: hypothetical protein ACE5G0_10110 [Rhodothermales bacterium]